LSTRKGAACSTLAAICSRDGVGSGTRGSSDGDFFGSSFLPVSSASGSPGWSGAAGARRLGPLHHHVGELVRDDVGRRGWISSTM
jgi:hypothetical protein